MLYDHYLEHAEARIVHTTVKVEVAGEFIIIDAAATAFRQEMDKSGPLARRQSLHWDSHPKMKDAIEKKLFSDGPTW